MTSGRKIKLLLSYDGSYASGWQVQPDRLTYQGLLEEAIRRLTGENTRVVGASRTDRGVHAIEQVAAFSTSSEHPPEVFRRALNGILPPYIRVKEAEYTTDDFHPRFSASSKEYIYVLENSPVRSPFLLKYACYRGRELNVEAMKEAASYLVGKKDFRAFQATGCSAKTTVREVMRLDITATEEIGFLSMPIRGRFIVFHIEANAFLRYMVRNMVGTLIEVGLGRYPASWVQEVVESRDRTRAGPTAPPEGLYLYRIHYGDSL